MTGLLIPADGTRAIIDDVRRYGGHGLETGAFLLGRGGDRQVETVALLGDRGIERRRDQLVIERRPMAALFDWVDDRDGRVVAQVHSHRLSASMSPTDRRFGLTVEGFISAIVPNAADPPADVDGWGWWTFRLDRWEPSRPPTLVSGRCRLVVFDADGVRDG